jgi:hypothetical protein
MEEPVLISVNKATRKHIIRTSDRGTFKKCRQLWDFTSKIRYDYEPLVAKDYFDFGTAWHAAMEAYYEPEMWNDTNKGDQGLTLLAFLKTTNDQRLAYDKLGLLDVELDQDFDSRVELGKGMLYHYFEWSAGNDDFTPVAVEQEFEVQIGYEGPGGLYFGSQYKDMPESDLVVPVYYQGRLDGLVKGSDGRYWILEHKTSSHETSTSWLDMDEQTGSYIFALEEKLNIDIVGVIWTRAMKRFPVPPSHNKKGKTLSTDRRQPTTAKLFLEELHNVGETLATHPDYAEYFQFLLDPDAAPRFIHRERIERSREMTDDIGRRILMEAEDMLDNPHIYPTVTPMNCNSCPFKGPCLARQEGSDWVFMLESSFRKRGTEGAMELPK